MEPAPTWSAGSAVLSCSRQTIICSGAHLALVWRQSRRVGPTADGNAQMNRHSAFADAVSALDEGDEPLHGGVRAAVAALGDEPVVDPPGGVALLPRGPEVGLENARDPFLVAPERGPAPPPGHRRGGRHVLHVGALRHGVPAHVEHSGDLGPRAPGGIHRPYIIHCVQGHGHLLHPSRAGSPK